MLKAITSSVLLAAIVMGSVMLSGNAEINLQHHLNLPPELENKNIISSHYSSVFDKLLGRHKTTDVRLGSKIEELETVNNVVDVLNKANYGDTIIFHIEGYGGEVETVQYLISNIKETKAHTVMVVEAPSFSGHAYVAASGNELVMFPGTYLMYHTSSAYGHDCSKETGTDRTVPNSEHCLADMKYHLQSVNKLLESFSFLTLSEIKGLETGHDVYITSDEYYSRKAGHKPVDGTSSALLNTDFKIELFPNGIKAFKQSDKQRYKQGKSLYYRSDL